MHTLKIPEGFTYDGSQLRSLFAYEKYGLLGDSMVAWRGPCAVDFDHMVDGEDRRAGATIAGSEMVHFIVEKFDCPLVGAVALQRLLSAMAIEVLRELSPAAQGLCREGDDIYLDDVSYRSVSPRYLPSRP